MAVVRIDVVVGIDFLIILIEQVLVVEVVVGCYAAEVLRCEDGVHRAGHPVDQRHVFGCVSGSGQEMFDWLGLL